jgi:hypothetical protein
MGAGAGHLPDMGTGNEPEDHQHQQRMKST